MSGIQANRFFQQIYSANQAASAGFTPATRNTQSDQNRDRVNFSSPGSGKNGRTSDPIRQLLGEIRGY